MEQRLYQRKIHDIDELGYNGAAALPEKDP